MISAIPSLSEYKAWVNTYMGIPASALPADSAVLEDSYDFGVTVVNPLLNLAGGFIYSLALYNFAGHWLVAWAPDQPNSYFPSPPAEPPSTVTDPTKNTGYFQWLRSPQGFNLNAFVPGVIRASNDVSTGQSLVVPKQLETLGLMDLEMVKTPWGRMYLDLAQMAGTDWGIT